MAQHDSHVTTQHSAVYFTQQDLIVELDTVMCNKTNKQKEKIVILQLPFASITFIINIRCRFILPRLFNIYTG